MIRMTHTDQVDSYESYGLTRSLWLIGIKLIHMSNTYLITNTDHVDLYDNTTKNERAAINEEKKLTSTVEQHNEAASPQCWQPMEEKKLELPTKKKLQRHNQSKWNSGTRMLGAPAIMLGAPSITWLEMLPLRL